jgi:NTE family protein
LPKPWKKPLLPILLGTQVNGRLIESMSLRLGIVATDLNSGQGMLFQRGDAATVVRASSALPALFQPVKILGREYVDGGLVSPVPMRYAILMGAKVIVAVDISNAPEGNGTGDTLQILLQIFSIMGKSLNSFELRDANVVVRPLLVGVANSDFGARRRAIQAGRVAMQALLPQLRAALKGQKLQ